MTIHGVFSDQAFGPEILADMSRAYESVCEALGLKMTDDPATRAVAEAIIECARRGVRDIDTLRTMVLQEFNGKNGVERSPRLQEVRDATGLDLPEAMP
jgi:hypothetical protein